MAGAYPCATWRSDRRSERLELSVLHRLVATCALVLSFAAAPGVRAAHPLQTEDTGTQGARNLEWENGLTRARSNAGAATLVYQPQLSFGAAPALDLILQPSWIRSRDSSGRAVEGLGDTNLDAKWRFFGRGPVSLAVRAGVTLSTSEHGQGLRHGTLSPHAVLIETIDLAPLTFHLNLGMEQNPSSSGLRRRVTAASGAAMWSIDEKLVLTTEAVWSSNPDPTRAGRVGTALVGVIYTLRPGLDFDMGWQRTGAGAPSGNALLVGLTCRFGI
jgi:hypothetical protein